MTTHGHAALGRTPEYRAWVAMKTRCNNPRVPCFEYYGGRGISVCERWLDSYEAFLGDMGLKPSPSHSIDRIDNGGNYEPSNCRWATLSEQAKNRRPWQRKTGDVALSRPLLNFRPKPEVAELIKTLAAEDRRPVSQFLAILVEDALATRATEQRSAA